MESEIERENERLKQENAALSRQLRKRTSRLGEYRERCRAYETSLREVDRLYNSLMRGVKWLDEGSDRTALAKANGVAMAAAAVRKTVAPTYRNPRVIDPRVLVDEMCTPYK